MRVARRDYVEVGESVMLRLPYSEVCMHMRVAGQVAIVRLDGPNSAQILLPDGRPFSAPITPGEAGLYRDSLGSHYLVREDL